MRYLDSCYINWTFGEQRLKVFNELVNPLNINIRFTVEYSKEQIAFLDVRIKKTSIRVERGDRGSTCPGVRARKGARTQKVGPQNF